MRNLQGEADPTPSPAPYASSGQRLGLSESWWRHLWKVLCGQWGGIWLGRGQVSTQCWSPPRPLVVCDPGGYRLKVAGSTFGVSSDLCTSGVLSGTHRPLLSSASPQQRGRPAFPHPHSVHPAVRPWHPPGDPAFQQTLRQWPGDHTLRNTASIICPTRVSWGAAVCVLSTLPAPGL